MPLPPSAEREALHTRTIEMRGYRRADGLFEVEGVLRDVKTHALPLDPPGDPVPPGEAIHDISVRLTFDDDLVVRDAVAAFDAQPYGDCLGAAPKIGALRGAAMKAGWRKEVQARLGHELGCTHIREMLPAMATVAFQTITALRKGRRDEVDAAGRPRRIDSCHGYGSGSEVVLLRWPQWHGSQRTPHQK